MNVVEIRGRGWKHATAGPYRHPNSAIVWLAEYWRALHGAAEAKKGDPGEDNRHRQQRPAKSEFEDYSGEWI